MKDIFNCDCSKLLQKKLFLFDMDGTIYEDNRVFKGTHELLKLISEIGGKYIFITNNSSKSVDDYVKKLISLHIEVDKSNFYTSSQATVAFLKKEYPNAKVYCQGTNSLLEELVKNGISVTNKCENVDLVLVGFDTEMTYEKLKNTCKILSIQDVPFIATNIDLKCPVDFGFIPDCGSICKMIEIATGRVPRYIGKPSPLMVESILKLLNYKKSETVIVGDRLYTDISTGINSNVDTVCVLTGEATISEIENGNIKPTFTFNSVLDIFNCLKEKNKSTK